MSQFWKQVQTQARRSNNYRGPKTPLICSKWDRVPFQDTFRILISGNDTSSSFPGDTISRFPTRSNICLLKPARGAHYGISALVRRGAAARADVTGALRAGPQSNPPTARPLPSLRWLVKGPRIRHGGGDRVVLNTMAAVIEECDFCRRDRLTIKSSWV